MTRYQEFCDAYYASEPARVKLDQLIRHLPERMRRAIAEILQVPDGVSEHLTAMCGRPVGYVFVAKRECYSDGRSSWTPVTSSDELVRRDEAGYPSFGIGIALDRPKGAVFPSYIYFAFQVEVASDTLFNLLISNSPKLIKIEVDKAECYEQAATELLDWLYDVVKDPKVPFGNRTPIGFGRGQE